MLYLYVYKHWDPLFAVKTDTGEKLCKGGYMSGKIRAQTWKHVIILIFSIVIALAMALHFSKDAFAEEVLPAVSAEDGTAAEDAQPEEALPEVGAAGLPEGSAEVDAGLNTAPEDDAAYVNAGSEAFGDAAEETSADALAESEAKASENAVQTEAAANAESEEKAGKEAAETEAPADTESGEKTVDEAVKADEAAPADSAAETADAGKSADAEQSGSAAETADAGKTADAEQSGSTAGTADAGKSAEAEQSGSAAGTADAVNSTEAGTTDSEEVNSGSEGEGSLVKAGETVDPLTYLAECLQYHGDELNPSAYSLRAYTEDGQSIVTEVKDQTPWQTCWGFSAIAASESSILAECYAKWDELAPGLLEKFGISTFKELCEWIDLSERHLAWFAFTPESENGHYPSQAGEGLYATEKDKGAVFNALGGNYYATSVFARGTGPIEEFRVPYENNEGVLNEGIKVIANDGTEYLDQDYVGYMTEARYVEYECLVPQGMTKEEVLDFFKDDPTTQERVRQRLEEGVITRASRTYKYVDDNGVYYHVVRMNELEGIAKGYPDILIFEDQDGIQYKFDPESLSFPRLPLIRRACYDWSVKEELHYASILELESSNVLPEYCVDNVVDETVIKAIKDELLSGRGVSVAFCADTAAPGATDKAKYMNMVNNAWAHYTYYRLASANHGVTIVGFNDNFPKTLFLEGHEPDRENSWGGGKSSGANFGNWGIDENGDGIGDGYFWLSYWDPTITTVETFDFNVESLVYERGEYDIRQYDLMTSAQPMRVTSDMSANVFTADATTNIREIGIQPAEDQTTVTYEIYLLDDDATDPTDGVLLTSGSEHYEYSGYHRIKTDKVCIIPEGFRYSVVVKQEAEGKNYVSIFLNLNEQSVIDREARGAQGITKYYKAVVNKGESYVCYNGQWMDWVDFIPNIQYSYAKGNPGVEEKWIDIDNFSIKVYADFINQDLSAEAEKIGSGEGSAKVGVADKDDAENDALIALAMVYNDIYNNTAAENASSVENGYISADDYDTIAEALIDPSQEAGLKVVVETREIPVTEIDGNGLKKLLNAANENIALYADISLLVFNSNTGVYLGSLHRTEKPMELAIALPSWLIDSSNPVYVLRLHNGVVEQLETSVEGGYAFFASDLFSQYALAYDISEPAGEPTEEPTEVVPADPGCENVKQVKCSTEKKAAKTGTKKSVETAVKVVAAETGDASNAALWLALMALAACAVLAAVFVKRSRSGKI